MKSLQYVILFVIVNILMIKLIPILLSFLDRKLTKVIEKNPKWIAPKLRENYYGFQDIDILLVKNQIGSSVRCRPSVDNKRLEILISDSMTTKDVDDIARLALSSKIKLIWGVYYPDKPAYWLSILCYMLDGGDIRQEAVTWEKSKK